MTGESLDFPSPPLANIFGITIKEMRNNNETRRTEVLSTMNEGSWMMSLLSVCLSVSVNCPPLIIARFCVQFLQETTKDNDEHILR